MAQRVVLERMEFEGHSALEPLQYEASAQEPSGAAQSVLASLNPFVGQVMLVPSQKASLAQLPSEEHKVPPNFGDFAGQVEDRPEQTALFSHGPAAASHTVPMSLRVLEGQEAAVPEQTALFSQGPEALAQVVELFL